MNYWRGAKTEIFLIENEEATASFHYYPICLMAIDEFEVTFLKRGCKHLNYFSRKLYTYLVYTSIGSSNELFSPVNDSAVI